MKDLIKEKSGVFIIAEAGVNHNGDFELAKKLVDMAKECGADAVKFQTWKTKNVISKHAPKAQYQKETTGSEENQFEMVKKLELESSSFHKLKEYADQRGIHFMSSPFDIESVHLLNEVGIDLFKVGSGEITNFELLETISKTGKPIIVSTGMSTLGEIESAIEAIRKAGDSKIYLMQCISGYPANAEDYNLKTIPTMKCAFKLDVGISDHTLNEVVALGAVALGANFVEKHVTLDNNMDGPDHRASMDPDAFKLFVKKIRTMEKALGDGVKKPTESEMEIARVARKSIVLLKDLPAGSVLEQEDLTVKRPGTGIAPKYLKTISGKKLKVDVKEDQVITWNMLQ